MEEVFEAFSDSISALVVSLTKNKDEGKPQDEQLISQIAGKIKMFSDAVSSNSKRGIFKNSTSVLCFSEFRKVGQVGK
jgi:hypothetical protein